MIVRVQEAVSYRFDEIDRYPRDRWGGEQAERHFVYWCPLSNGDIGIVAIPHERMHQIDRFQEDFGQCALVETA